MHVEIEQFWNWLRKSINRPLFCSGLMLLDPTKTHLFPTWKNNNQTQAKLFFFLWKCTMK